MGITTRQLCLPLSVSYILLGRPVGGDVPSSVHSELQYGKGQAGPSMGFLAVSTIFCMCRLCSESWQERALRLYFQAIDHLWEESLFEIQFASQ